MDKMLESVLKVISYVNILSLISLTVVTMIDVVARYVFSTSFLDAITISSFLLAIINAMALAGITYNKGHIQVELIIAHLPASIRTALDAINSLLAGILFFIMAWFAFARAARSYQRGLYQGWMQLPDYPVKFLFALGCLLTAVTFVVLFIKVFIKKNG